MFFKNAELEKRILSFRKERDWEQFHTPRTLASSISIEAAELLEIFQWVKDKDIDQLIKEKEVHLQEEIADIAMYLFFLSNDLGIDIEAAVSDKLKKNEVKYPVEKFRGIAKKYDEKD